MKSIPLPDHYLPTSVLGVNFIFSWEISPEKFKVVRLITLSHIGTMPCSSQNNDRFKVGLDKIFFWRSTTRASYLSEHDKSGIRQPCESRPPKIVEVDFRVSYLLQLFEYAQFGEVLFNLLAANPARLSSLGSNLIRSDHLSR